MSHLARQEIYFDRQFSLDETLEGIERVTPADVQRVAGELFSNGSLAATVLGQVNGLQLPTRATESELDDGRSTIREMIARYTHPDMGRIWSEERRFETWLQVEIAAAEVMADAGIIPHEAARDIRERVEVRRRPHRRHRRNHPARRHRLYDRGCRARRAFCPLAALRPDVLGRRRYCAGAFRCARRRTFSSRTSRRCSTPSARGPRSIGARR